MSVCACVQCVKVHICELHSVHTCNYGLRNGIPEEGTSP